MKRTLIAAAILFALWWTRAALAQELEAPIPPVPSMSMAYDGYLSAPAPAGPTVPSASPSDRPVQPSAGPPIAADSALAPGMACDEQDGDEPLRLLDFPFLAKRRIEVRGWLDQSFTWNPDSPGNRFNGPVTFNDRSNEYMLNQLYLITERVTDTEDRVFDLGGRIDLIYGTDHRFLMANGLEFETNADGSIEQTWNRDHRFYGVAMPQAYADLAWRDWVFRFGRFYTVVGHEVCTSPDNFFLSHSYTTQYGEPFTHTGMLAKWQLNDRLALSAGFHRGWDQWEDNNDKLGVLGGITWTSLDEDTSISLGIISSNEQPAGESTRNLVSFVFSQRLGERWKYVFQSDIAHEQNALLDGQDAEWYGLVNYLYYELNPCWSLGARYEWFSDDDGVRVAGLGYPKGISLNTVPSHWQEFSLGVNYTPNANVLVRSELRWDWVDPLVPVNDHPFDDYSDGSQFLWGTDLILKF